MDAMDCSSSSQLQEGARTAPYKATQLWQEVIRGFRAGMPRRRKRVKMRCYDNCFTGTEAVEWLLGYMQTTGLFGLVSRQQVEKLMQKFLESDVIKEVRGKLRRFDLESAYLYQFVTEPGPLNFVEELQSPLGKHRRGSVEGYDGTCIANEYAFMKHDDSSEGVGQAKRHRSSLAGKLAVIDANTRGARLSPAQVAGIWKELTLARLLRLVELPTLDGVIAHDAVDGKQIEQNVKLVTKLTVSKTARQQKHQACSNDAVTDVPNWVILAMKCLSKWPEGCTEEFVGGMPVYCGFELDVLRSLVQYFTSLPEPLISPNLYDLHTAVLNLIQGKKAGAADALQLCSLLLPQTNRIRLHRVLRFIHKAGANPQLRLSKTHTNSQVLLSYITPSVLHPPGRDKHSEHEKASMQTLVAFMSQHYQHIFKIPEDLRKQVQHRLAAEAGSGQPEAPRSSFCQQVSKKQYEEEGRTASRRAIAALLDRIIADKSMTTKVKSQRLKLFQREYPEIYSERFPSEATPTLAKQDTVISNPLQILR